MRPLPLTPELLRVAQRVVWFKEPKETLANPMHFLAYAMTYGTVADLQTLGRYLDTKDYCEVLENAPSGIFDPRSWAYWNVKCGRQAGLAPERFR